MVLIEIDDLLWEYYCKSWVLCDVRDEDKIIHFLEERLYEEASAIFVDIFPDIFKDAERQKLTDAPEALVRRAIGIEQEMLHKLACSLEKEEE